MRNRERGLPTKNERLQDAWRSFESKNNYLPNSARQAVEWAVAQGILTLPSIDPYDVLAGEMANALREEYATDAQGRRYRVNHAVRITKSGVQYTFWAMLGYAPYSHMEKAFAQRREQIVGDCHQLKTDVDVYNDMNLGKQQEIQMVLDFTDDVAERQLARDSRSRAA
jgi:hypothetical protein